MNGTPSPTTRCLDALRGEDFAGNLQGDGYRAYPALGKGREAGWIWNQIRLLYRWEAQLRQSRAGPVLRQVMRSSHHRRVGERLRRARLRLRPRYLPQSLMGRAIGHALNQWPTLEWFLEHGEVEIDNHLVENVIRPTALGK